MICLNNLDQQITKSNNLVYLDVKNKITSIIYSLHFECCYHVEDCIIDLHKLLLVLDNSEISQ